jgi:putative methylase
METFLHNRKQLEITLESVPPHPAPKIQLEQYTITSHMASEMLFISAIMHDDIKDRYVIDLGCGTGRLAIGAALLDAKEVLGVDIDPTAVNTARESSKKMNLEARIQWVISDLDGLNGHFDTVLQNPPFGVRRRGADRMFMRKAIEVGNVIYSLHKSGGRNREFIKSLVSKHRGTITDVYQMTLVIPHTFRFHSRREHVVPVDLYRVVTVAAGKQ